MVTPQKEAQISEFLDHVLASEPMKVAHNFLASRVSKGVGNTMTLRRLHTPSQQLCLCRAWWQRKLITSKHSCTKCSSDYTLERPGTTLVGEPCASGNPLERCLVGTQALFALRFEHIFVGESKQGNIQGLHNWLQFYNLEQQGSLDYRGYIFPRHKYAFLCDWLVSAFPLDEANQEAIP